MSDRGERAGRALAFEPSASPTGTTRRERAEAPVDGTRKMSREEILSAELFDEVREGETVTDPEGVPERPDWVAEVQAVVDREGRPDDDWEGDRRAGVPLRDKLALAVVAAAIAGGVAYLALRRPEPPPLPPPAAAPAPTPAPVPEPAPAAAVVPAPAPSAQPAPGLDLSDEAAAPKAEPARPKKERAAKRPAHAAHAKKRAAKRRRR